MSNVIPFPRRKRAIPPSVADLLGLVIERARGALRDPKVDPQRRAVYAALLRGHARLTQGELAC